MARHGFGAFLGYFDICIIVQSVFELFFNFSYLVVREFLIPFKDYNQGCSDVDLCCLTRKDLDLSKLAYPYRPRCVPQIRKILAAITNFFEFFFTKYQFLYF